MTRHPRYASTDEPILIGDIVSYEGDIYEITSIGTTAIGIIVSGYSADTGQTFSTDFYTPITKASEERANAYRDPRNAEVWDKAFDIAEESHASICRISLSDPNTCDSTCPPTCLFALVPDDIEVKDIAPWAVCSIHPTMATDVGIAAIDREYAAPHRMRAFAESLVDAYESRHIMVSRHLWLVARDASVADWHDTELDKACRRLVDTYHEYYLDPQDVAAHVTDMCEMFRTSRPDMRDGSPEKRSLDWWRGYAATLANA